MFFHSPAVVLANSIAEALAGRNVAGARQHLDKLYREAPNHPELAALTGGDPTDRGMRASWRCFLEFEDSLPPEERVGIEDIPAWLLLHEPGLARALPSALDVGVRETRQAFHLAQCLSLAQGSANGAGALDLRRELLDLQPALFRYFKSRL